jgi:hypothetical protein
MGTIRGMVHIKAYSEVYGGCPVIMTGEGDGTGQIKFPTKCDRIMHVGGWDEDNIAIEVTNDGKYKGPLQRWAAIGVKVFNGMVPPATSESVIRG